MKPTNDACRQLRKLARRGFRDYPEDEKCPHCPFWADKDRWAKVIPPDKPL